MQLFEIGGQEGFDLKDCVRPGRWIAPNRRGMPIGRQLNVRENALREVGMIEGVVDAWIPMRFDWRPAACGHRGEQLLARRSGREVVSLAHQEEEPLARLPLGFSCKERLAARIEGDRGAEVLLG